MKRLQTCEDVGGSRLIIEAAHLLGRQSQRRAGAQDRGELDLAEDLEALHDLGLLMAPLPHADGGCSLGHGRESVDPTIGVLTELGQANLPLARVYEGHVNAVKLITIYGTGRQRRVMAEQVDRGVIHGVWGADDDRPARLVQEAGSRCLDGGKRYASGAGSIGRAVVPVTDPDGGQQLLLLDVGDRDRVDLSPWTASGMRASDSGVYEMTGIEIGEGDFLGKPGDFTREPWFIGGIWRCAAAQLGAIERLVEETRAHLESLDRLGDPFQLQRLGAAIMAARTARLWVRDAALKVEAASEVTEAVAAAGMARLMAEEAGLEVMRLAQRSIGLAGFSIGHPVERLCRDLGVYLRQAAPDLLLLNATRQLLALDRPLPGFSEPGPAWA